MDKVLKSVRFPINSNTLIGASGSDDAGIYKLSKDTALVQTVDFFTPIVDDPYTFGQIAAANSVSDVYAMGGVPISALNIVCFPESTLDDEVLTAIIQGGADKMAEADTMILGGHTIQDKELKYGLAVTGIVHPEKVKLNRTVKIGDKILLTKPIGTGILTTALKNEKISDSDLQPAIDSMLLLNKKPSQLLTDFGVSGCTDVTGFGLLGHLWEMVNNLDLGVKIYVKDIPVFNHVTEFAKESMFIPGGTLANIKYLEKNIVQGNVPLWYLNLLCDPQTSGGLLISISEQDADHYINALKEYPCDIQVIGEVVKEKNRIFLE